MTGRERIDEIVAATNIVLWSSRGAVYRHYGYKGCHCANSEEHGAGFYLTRSEVGCTRDIYVPLEVREEGS